MKTAKKQVFVEYYQFDINNTDSFVDWIENVTNDKPCKSIEATLVPRCFYCITDNGKELLYDGDYVVYENDKLYVYKPNDFQKQYEV